MSADDENHLTGEALFLRAYYHFKLIMSWEKIIIRNEYLTGESQTHKALSTRTEAWDFICTELDKAGSMLPQDRLYLRVQPLARRTRIDLLRRRNG